MIDNVIQGEKITASKQNEIIGSINQWAANADAVEYNLDERIKRLPVIPNLFQIQISKDTFELNGSTTVQKDVIHINLGADADNLKESIRIDNVPVTDVIWIDSYDQQKDCVIDDSFLSPEGLFKKGWIKIGLYNQFSGIYQNQITQIMCNVAYLFNAAGVSVGAYAIITTDAVTESEIESRVRRKVSGVTEIRYIENRNIAQSTSIQSIPISTTGKSARQMIQTHVGDISIFTIKADSEMSAYLSDWVYSNIGFSIDRKEISGINYVQLHDFELSDNSISVSLSVDGDNETHILSDGTELDNIQFLMRYQNDVLHPELVYVDISSIVGLSGGGDSIYGDASTDNVKDSQRSIETLVSNDIEYHQLYDFDDDRSTPIRVSADMEDMNFVVRTTDLSGVKTIEYRDLKMTPIDVVTDISVVQGNQGVNLYVVKRQVCVFDPQQIQQSWNKIFDIEEEKVVTESTYNNRSHEFNNKWTRYAMIKPMTPDSGTDMIFRATYHGNEHHDCLDYNS